MQAYEITFTLDKVTSFRFQLGFIINLKGNIKNCFY